MPVMKKIGLIIIVAILAGGIGFFAGMEYKAYQVRTALTKAFQQTSSSPTPAQETSQPSVSDTNSIIDQARQEGDKIISKNIGDEVVLATIKFKINKVTEASTLSGGYGNPMVAPAGSKFVLLNMTVTNETNASFNLDPSNGFVVVDNKRREFNPQNAIGEVTNYLDQRELQPSIPETGTIVYLLPSDSISYSFNILKAGAKELYQIKLK